MRNLKNVWARPVYKMELEFDNGTWKTVEVPLNMERRIPKLELLRDRALEAARYAGKAAEDETLSDAMYEALDNADSKAYNMYLKLDDLIDKLKEMLELMDTVSEDMDFVFDYCREFTIKEEEIA